MLSSDLKGGYSGTMQDLVDIIGLNIGNFDLPLVDQSTPRCILTVNGENVTSDYGYTLDILHDVINVSNSSDYIKNGDYIMLTTLNGDEFKMEFNIDTYYNKYADGDGNTTASHHIDMISRHLIPNSNWPMRSTDTNNGTALYPNPYLASSDDSGCVVPKLASYYNSNIPNILKAHIIKKKLVVPYRYQVKDPGDSGNYSSSGVRLYMDTGGGLETLPALWIPFSYEVNLATHPSYFWGFIGGLRQYPTLDSTSKRIKKNANSGGTISSWWTASDRIAYNFDYIGVSTDGVVGERRENYATSTTNYVPLCFRFV